MMNTLDQSPDSATYSVAGQDNIITNNLGLAGQFRRNLLNADEVISVTWTGDGAMYKYLKQAYRAFVASGGNPFLCNLVLEGEDFGLVECRFIAGSMKLSGVTGEVFTVTASLSAKVPAYDVVGQDWVSDVGLSQTIFPVASGIYVLSGQNVNFRLSVTHFPIPTGLYVLTGIAANLTARLESVPLETGIYALTGFAADLAVALIPALVKGLYSLTGFDAALSVIAPSPPSDFAINTTWFDGTDTAFMSTNVSDATSGAGSPTTDGDSLQWMRSKDPGTFFPTGFAHMGLAQSGFASALGVYKTGIINGHSVGRINHNIGTAKSYPALPTASFLSSNADLWGAIYGQTNSPVQIFNGTYIAALAINDCRTDSGTVGANDSVLGSVGGQFTLECFKTGSAITLHVVLIPPSGPTLAITLTGINLGDAFIVSVKFDASTVSARLNGGSWVTHTTTGLITVGDTNWQVGNSGSTLELDVAHAATFAATLSDADVTNVELYFANQLAIVI